MQTQDRGRAPHSSAFSPARSPRPPRKRQAQPTQCFSVQALADPGTLPRVVDAGPEQAQLIAQELRRQFCVEAVLVAEKQDDAHA